MIYSKSNNTNEEEFNSLLHKTKQLLLDWCLQHKNISALEFESLVCEMMKQAAVSTKFEDTIHQTGKNDFPDIVAHRYFGVEVKTTVKDSWTSIGNSILESSRAGDVEKIYLLFAKFGGTVDICFRLYQECLPAITVTHSPRYKIDMNLPIGESIFDKMGIGYDELRTSNEPIQQMKEYYRSRLREGESLWWLDESQESGSTSPVIRTLNSFDKSEKHRFIIESIILFPEMFGSSGIKFERAASYLITEYNAVSASLRDTFTAGGQKKIDVHGSEILVPAIFWHLYVLAQDIATYIDTIEEGVLMNYWRVESIEDDRLVQWKKKLDDASSGSLECSASDIFDAGLQGVR